MNNRCVGRSKDQVRFQNILKVFWLLCYTWHIPGTIVQICDIECMFHVCDVGQWRLVDLCHLLWQRLPELHLELPIKRMWNLCLILSSIICKATPYPGFTSAREFMKFFPLGVNNSTFTCAVPTFDGNPPTCCVFTSHLYFLFCPAAILDSKEEIVFTILKNFCPQHILKKITKVCPHLVEINFWRSERPPPSSIPQKGWHHSRRNRKKNCEHNLLLN